MDILLIFILVVALFVVVRQGWFMETEITRDLLEPGRMDKMEDIARAIGVDPTDEEDFWRERVAIETNKAVMHSFRQDGHSIVDHVTAQGQFLAHDAREKREGRECPAQWSWVVVSLMSRFLIFCC